LISSCVDDKNTLEAQDKIELNSNPTLVNEVSTFQSKDETGKIHLTQTRMKIHHSSSTLPMKNKPFKDDNFDTLELRLINLGLVDVQTVNPNIRVDLKYSSDDNFMGINVYGNLRKAFLRKEVAQKLNKAQEELTRIDSNLFLLVYDAARPQWVQYKMWQLLDTVPVNIRTKFVSNPRNGSLHNYGAAVDLTICDKFGNILDMGAGFDDPREIAYPSKENYFFRRGLLSAEQIKNRQLLRKVMNLAGFYNIQTEWWHFNSESLDQAKKKYQLIP
jgi:D-alanyl-D-alanine dipeptidase